jgi:hypothetical protein
MFEHIEKLKRAFTDKYVVVDAARPELTRFRNATGLIKTINMNGRALVEFDQWDNIGWYDIELDFLKVVPKPAAEKPAAAAKPAAAGAKASTADILAAARAKKAGGETATAAPAAKPAPAAPTAKPAAAAPAGKMSTSDILAMARGKAAAAAAAPAAAPAKKTAPPKPEPVVEEEPAAVAAPVAAPAKPAKAAASGPLPTTTAEKIAYCRKVDAKG